MRQVKEISDDSRAQVLAGEAQVLAAQANVIQAELNLSYTNITSPIRGLASKAIYREGTLISTRDQWAFDFFSFCDRSYLGLF